MSVKFVRKTVVAAAATALLGSGLAVGLGSGVAGAEGSLGSAGSSESGCTIEASVKTGASKDYTITKKVEDGGKVAPDGTIATQIKVTGPGAMVYEIRDFFPEGFVMEKVELNPKWVISGQKWEDATDTATVSDGAVRLGTTGGWTTSSNGTVSMRVTYRAPKNITPGQTIPMPGVGVNVGVIGGNEDFRDMGLCLDVRLPNPVEGGSSILRGLGLGSVADLGDNFTGSISDPSSPLNRLSDSLGG